MSRAVSSSSPVSLLSLGLRLAFFVLVAISHYPTIRSRPARKLARKHFLVDLADAGHRQFPDEVDLFR
jgi:hypothetical protein